MFAWWYNRAVRVGVITLVAYVAVGFFALISTFMVEMGVTQTVVAPHAFSAPPTGEVEGSIRNVFGDPVPSAIVHLDGFQTKTDADGTYRIRQVETGKHRFLIEAEGYNALTFDLLVEDGRNVPLIKYETGLRPIGVMLDFHVFWSERDSPPSLYAHAGIANGTMHRLFISGLQIRRQHSTEVIHDFLSDTKSFERMAIYYSEVDIATAHGLALTLPPHRVISPIEMPPVPLDSIEGLGAFEFIVHYALGDNYAHQQERVLHITAEPVREDDYNPHTP